MNLIGHEIRGRIFSKDPELGSVLQVWEEAGIVYIAPSISPRAWEAYIKSLPEEVRGRAYIYRARCRHYLYQRPAIRKMTIKEYPVLKYSPSILQETANEVVNDNTVSNYITESIRRLIGG